MSEYLIRRATRPAERDEQLVQLESHHWAAKLLRLALPIGGTRYLAPKGRLRARIAFDGKPLEVRIQGSGEVIKLFPKLQITGLAEFQEGTPDPAKSAGLLCAHLHNHYEEQIMWLRTLIDAAFVDVIGVNCPGQVIDSIVEWPTKPKRPAKTGIETTVIEQANANTLKILQRIRDDIGIEVEWFLEGDQETLSWIRRLQAVLLRKAKQSYNKASANNQFNLTFSCKIRGVIPSRHDVALRRARDKASAEEEIDKILDCVHMILDPALGIFTGNVKVWLYPNFWKLLKHAFDTLVYERIAEEFGYAVSFDDFKRERTAAEDDVTGLLEGAQQRHKNFLLLDAERDQILKDLLQARRDSGHDPEAGNVKRLELALVKADGELKGARERMEIAAQGRGLEHGRTDDQDALLALKQFNSSLQLGRGDLVNLNADDEKE